MTAPALSAAMELLVHGISPYIRTYSTTAQPDAYALRLLVTSFVYVSSQPDVVTLSTRSPVCELQLSRRHVYYSPSASGLKPSFQQTSSSAQDGLLQCIEREPFGTAHINAQCNLSNACYTSTILHDLVPSIPLTSL